MVFPFFKFLNNNKQENTTTNNSSPNQSAKLKGSNHTVHQTVNNGPIPPTPDEVEAHRRNQLVGQLRNQWLLSNDGISPARMAGLEWGQGEQAWVNRQLQSRGEHWQV